MYKAKQDHIYVVIERKIIAAEGLCDDCKGKGLAQRWAMVRRYIVPPDTPYDKLFGIGDGSIEPKGLPDNMSTGAVEFLQIIRGEARQQGMKIGAWTVMVPDCSVDGYIKTIASDDNELYANDFLDGDDAVWDLDPEWLDPTPPTPYRIVAWRVAAKKVAEHLVVHDAEGASIVGAMEPDEDGVSRDAQGREMRDADGSPHQGEGAGDENEPNRKR